MHGIIHAELQKFVIKNHGHEAWRKLLVDAGCETKVYLASQQYPDAEMVALVTAASKLTGVPAADLLERFGEFIVPGLMSLYGPLVQPHWRTLDLLEHTEKTIHTVVRLRSPASQPPELRCIRVGPTQVTISYASARKLCGVAKGIIRGLARHYGETVTVDELACMHRGASSCEISVTLAQPSAQPSVNAPVATVRRSAASAR